MVKTARRAKNFISIAFEYWLMETNIENYHIGYFFEWNATVNITSQSPRNV